MSHSWGWLILISLQSLISYSSLSRVGALWGSPFKNHVAIGLVIVRVLFSELYCWRIMSVSSLTFLVSKTSPKSSWSSGSYNGSTISSSMFLESYMQDLSCSCTPRSGGLCILTSLVFCKYLHLLQRQTSLMSNETI